VVAVTIAPPASTALDVGTSLTLGASVTARNGAGTGVVWSSSAPAIATVVDGVVTGVAPGETIVRAQAEADRARQAELRLTVLAPRVVTPVAVTPALVPLRVGGTATLVAAVRTTGGLPTTARFVSSDTTVARVLSTDGITALVRGLRAGDAVVTVQAVADPTATATSTIRVMEPGVARVVLGALRDSLRIGARREFTATLIDSGGAVLDARPGIVWSVDRPDVAVVAASGPLGAQVTATGAGTAILTATIPEVPGSARTVSASAVVVVAPGVRVVRVTPDSVRLRVGTQRALAASVLADAGVSTGIAWSSDDPAVARVDAGGLVTGRALGRTVVRATSTHDPHVAAAVPVTVTSGVLSVRISPPRDTVRVGNDLPLAVALAVESPDVPARVVAVSRDTMRATVAVRPVGGGAFTATVTARFQGQTYIVVSSPDDPSVRDSLLLTIADPCRDFVPLTIGQTFAGTVGWGSCRNSTEYARFTLAATTFFEVTPTTSFAGIVSPFGASGWRWDFEWLPATRHSFHILAAPGTYWLNVASRAGTRLPFSVRTAVVPPRCDLYIITTHGVTATFPIGSDCERRIVELDSYVGGVGTHNTLILRTPILRQGDSVTVTATSADFAPYIEIRSWEGEVLASTRTHAAGATATLTFRHAGRARLDPEIYVTSRALNATGSVTVSIAGPPFRIFDDSPALRAPAVRADRRP
jgi:uncharacterized protein YjdB